MERMEVWKGSKSLAVVLAFVAALFFVVSLAGAELTEHGDLFVRFEGGISPSALPRERRAPIAVSVGGTIRTLSGERPPALRTIRIELNRGGRLDTHGLERCRYSQLVAASPARALQECRGALVGDGFYDAQTAFPEQGTFPSQGHILAFNAVYRGHTAILAHVFGVDPLPITRIIIFHVRRAAGPFGTVIIGTLPAAVNRYGYLEGILLRLHRRFTVGGHRRSFLSAACAAPPGFPSALFPFARASMTFADGRILASTLTRSCRVSG